MSERTESRTWFDEVEHCWFGLEDGVYVARFFGKFHGETTLIEWQGEDARLSEENWERYLNNDLFADEPGCTFRVPVPPEILQKISTHKAELTE